MSKGVDPTADYHDLLLRTSRIAMGALVVLAAVEAIAYAPRAYVVPNGIDLISAGGRVLGLWSAAWAFGAIWCVVTIVRGRGGGALFVALMCCLWSLGFWFSWGSSIVNPDMPVSRDYLGGTIYACLAVLLFTGRVLARGLLILSARHQAQQRKS